MMSHRPNVFSLVCCNVLVVTLGLATADQQLADSLGNTLNQCKFEFKPRHCGDIRRAGQIRSGVYTVFHEAAGPSGQRVYCDMDTDGGGWTVIQRRGQYGNNAYYFYRNWTEYAQGFGEVAKEYWIGNRALHSLTNGKEAMSLRVALSNSTEDTVSVGYQSVRISSEDCFFKIIVGTFLGPKGWDGMTSSNGNSFSTFDKDNDMVEGNCASVFRGAWWHGSSCSPTNLNGLNLNGHHKCYGEGIEWSPKDHHYDLVYYSYPSVHMMIRPSVFTLKP